MSEGTNGYGPPGSRYGHCIFVHQVKSSPMGTEITLILDDQGWIDRLMVAYPPDDSEWRDKFLTILDPGPPVLRSCSVVAPPGQPIVAFRPIDASGEAIPELCCMYRIVQGDWLRDVAPERKVTELVGGESPTGPAYLEESAEVNARLYTEGDSFNCCMCGTIVVESAGYHFRDLSGDQVRALRLMSSVANQFPFVCHVCYRKHLGAAKAAIGSAAGLQAWIVILLLICVRGYIAAMLGHNFWGVRTSHEQTIMIWAFFGSFLPFENVPGMLGQVFKNPLVLMGVFLGPVAFIAFASANPTAAREFMASPSMYLLGQPIIYLNFKIAQTSVYGSLAGFALGSVLGTVDPKKKNQDVAKSTKDLT